MPSYPSPPILTTNRDQRTLAGTIREHLKHHRQNSTSPAELLIATGYFNAQGWFAVATEIEKLSKIRLLVGCEQQIFSPETPAQKIFQPQQENRFREQINAIFLRHEKYLIQEYNEQPFEQESTEMWQNLPKALRRGNIEVRRYKKSFFHAKTWILKDTSSTVGSSNLTYAGLQKNQETNITLQNSNFQQELESWYEEVWNEAEDYDLAAVYDGLIEEYTPYAIYLKTLYECFQDEIEITAEDENDNILSLTNFQKHGVIRAKRILEKYKGVLIADTVGLGKTFIAGAIMKDYIFNRRQKVILLVPASMRSTWKNFLRKHDLSDIETLSYEGFARRCPKEQLRHKNHLYQLVVIDEAHNYRNPDTKGRAKILLDFLATNPSRDLVLLTATPVNNSIRDLQTLFGYFLDDNALEAYKVPFPSLKNFFRRLKKEENEADHTKQLQHLVDAVTVKRTRKFVQKHYPDAKLPDNEGNLKPVTFPEVNLKTVKYNFNQALPDIFEQLEDILSANNGNPPKLTLAIYQVKKYLIEPEYDEEGNLIQQEPNIIGLIRSLILKRFESSIRAFYITIENMRKKHLRFLQKLDEGTVIITTSKRPPPSDGDEESWEEEKSDSAENYDYQSMRKDIEKDLDLLTSLIAKNIYPEDDPKLKQLVEEIDAIAKQAENDGGTERQQKNNRKVLIFSYYKDTAYWIYNFLQKRLLEDSRLSVYQGKGCLLYTSGSDMGKSSTNPNTAAQHFAPETSVPGDQKISIQDECDILITTDVLSEGKNLQQCRHIISYDLPWNPMRLIQRHGRIDRLNSQHKAVFMRTFFPEDKLDKFLSLEDKVRKKLLLAAISTGIEASPIEGGAESSRTYSERREELEKIEKGDATVVAEGKSRFDLKTTEEYRQILLKALEDLKLNWEERLHSMPFKVGSGKISDQSGHFFCAKVNDDSQTFLRFVSSDASQEPVKDFIHCLELLECDEDTERVLSENEWKQAFPAWEKARQSITDDWNVFAEENSHPINFTRVNKEVIHFLTAHHPPGVVQNDLSKVIKKLRMVWRLHDEKDLRKIWNEMKKENEHLQKNSVPKIARNLYDFVAAKKMTPSIHCKRYECISKDCVRLICWMSFRKHVKT